MQSYIHFFFSHKIRNSFYQVGFAVIFFLLYLKPHLLYPSFYQADSFTEMNRRTERFITVSDNRFAQISLIDIGMRIMPFPYWKRIAFAPAFIRS